MSLDAVMAERDELHAEKDRLVAELRAERSKTTQLRALILEATRVAESSRSVTTMPFDTWVQIVLIAREVSDGE